MSEPNRYTLEMVSSEGGEVHWMHDNGQGLNAPLGEYVLYSDYARLKAEVERLRKAGDALVDEGETMAHDVSWVPCVWDNKVADWSAAKEGKQS